MEKMLEKRPMARSRLFGNWSLTMPEAVGRKLAAPSPWRKRQPTNVAMFGARPQARELSVKSRSEARYNGLRPKVSLSLPMSGITLVTAIM